MGHHPLITLALIACTWPATAADDDPQREGWPWYRGPFGNGTGHECGQTLVQDLSQARLVWQSEDWIPRTQGTIKHAGQIDGSGAWDVKGSCSSPVMQDGKIFLYYYRGSSEQVSLSQEYAKMSKAKKGGEEMVLAKCKELGITREEFERLGGNIHGDDVMHCIDAATGKTLWRTAVPGGLNYQASSYGPHLSPSVNQGRVFAVGTTGRVICWEASSGELLWINTDSPVVEQAQETLASCLQKGKCAGINRGHYEIAIAVDGVVLHRAERGPLMGMDAATGKTLWTGSGNWMLIPWKANGKWYVLDGPRCLDPKTGQVLWEAKADLGPSQVYTAVDGNVLVCGTTGFRIDPKGIEQIWTQDDLDPEGIVSPVIHRDHWIGRTSTGEERAQGKAMGKKWNIRSLDLKSGAVVGQALAKDAAHGGMLVAGDGRIIQPQDGAYGKWTMYAIEGGGIQRQGEEFRLPGDCSHTPIYWKGLLFFKGGNRLFCYDLRAR